MLQILLGLALALLINKKFKYHSTLTTLILPWAGCQYAREVQTVLRASQEQALLASAGTIAMTSMMASTFQ